MKALILCPFDPQSLNKLAQSIEVIHESWTETRRLLSPEELSERVQMQDFAVVLVEADFVFDEVFAATDKLRLVGTCRAATDHIDVDVATEHGVIVVNSPARNAVAVAELTIALMLSLARHVPLAHQTVKSGQWLDPVEPYISLRGVELTGKTVGIIGLGAVGREVAKRLAAFDMRILSHDPYVSAQDTSSIGAKKTSIERLMAESDFVTIHCPLSSETRGLVNEERIRSMKPAAYLVNTAAWEIIEERPLIEALQRKSIAGAAFDVYETHPVPLGSPLLTLDNVVLTPHIGGATEDTVKRYSKTLTEDVERFLSGRRPVNLVNPTTWKENGK